jgi:hypothetical protein
MPETNGKPLPISRISLTVTNVIAILVLAGGWIYNYAIAQEMMRENTRRIVVLESIQVSRVEFDLKEKELTLRLDRIESKIDSGAVDTSTDLRAIRKEWSRYSSHPKGHQE